MSGNADLSFLLEVSNDAQNAEGDIECAGLPLFLRTNVGNYQVLILLLQLRLGIPNLQTSIPESAQVDMLVQRSGVSKSYA